MGLGCEHEQKGIERQASSDVKDIEWRKLKIFMSAFCHYPSMASN
jgi:hypothetical protein